MGEFDRPEWVPSEEELRAELCNAREIDWPAEASKEANRREQWMITAPDEYSEYMQGLSKDARNFPEIPLRYMDAPADWMGKSLEAILNQIQSSPEEYQGYITGMVNRYLTACFKRLGGKWPSDIWDGSGNPYFTRICYDFCCPEWVGDDDLLRKIIVLQKLQAMISERVGQAGGLKSDIPGGFEGFCVAKINEMPETVRDAFLNTNSGDSSYYKDGQEWKAEYNLTATRKIKSYQSPISRAKAYCKSLSED
ncbi:hypothetical protein [Chlorobium phaeobacteroides]|uniref:Uncharacterized protein n=1 Tax=Chlorobium phaeobacteroides (strain DSM 266 / SMG 266 / 2430) TaxID=290317 RepID=A1BI53_CHLPD|nr:hypothetical protein [Chlorobium phaeobacteroides]ABL66080.1 hypothetical protein Cpha266_2068 [Chlorobium phaeobacteroides DSM 266]